jgi:uncharacterized membrane protein YebE (DUF533 family)
MVGGAMTKEKRGLGRDVFLALAAIGWADRELKPDEADAIVRMAIDEGLPLEEIAKLEEETKNPVEVGEIDIEHMTKDERLFVYAVGCWIARVDGQVAPEEITALNQLAEALKLPDKPREHADNLAIEVAKASESDKPLFYRLNSLRKTLRARLKQASKLREQQEEEEERK